MFRRLPKAARPLKLMRKTESPSIAAILYHGTNEEYLTQKISNGLYLPGEEKIIYATPYIEWAVKLAISNARDYNANPLLLVIDTKNQWEYLVNGSQFSNKILFNCLDIRYFKTVSLDLNDENENLTVAKNKGFIEQLIKESLGLEKTINLEEIK